MATEIEHDTLWTFTATCQTQNRTPNLSRTQGIKIFARQCIQDRAMQQSQEEREFLLYCFWVLQVDGHTSGCQPLFAFASRQQHGLKPRRGCPKP